MATIKKPRVQGKQGKRPETRGKVEPGPWYDFRPTEPFLIQHKQQKPSRREIFPMSDLSDPDDRSLCSRVECRTATPTDILRCFQLEKSWNKNASKIDLQYRQHHAAPFFRCAVMESGDDEDIIVGFVCSTRINEFQDDNVLKSHRASGTILMIHSIVVAEEYRRQGLGKLMLNDYLQSLRNASLKHPVSDVTVFATQELLTFFLHCGFSVVRPRANADDEEQQYLLTMSLDSSLQGTNGREFYVVDSFASKSGTGNPAAVVLLPEDTNIEELDKWMQTVAAEFNLSETAFCWPQSQAQNSENEVHWNVRFYTPKVEVPLCGHATLASAAVLYQTLQPKPQCRIVFHALEDELIMQLAPASETMTMRQRKICMEFPSKPPTKLTSNDDKSAVSKMLEAAFSCQLELTYIGISEIGDILVELTPESFWKIGYERLNYSALLEWDGYSRGIIVCCISECDSNKEGRDSTSPVPDFHSRFFGPKAGINEDPVTGSAHCVLGPYFADKLKKDSIVGQQMSERGGFVECLVNEDKVRLTGSAFTTMSGTLWI